MLCGYPVNIGNGRLRPCNQCMSCRINQKRRWVGRLLLETQAWEKIGLSSSFITLTYSDENLPPGGSLDPGAPRHFIQRFRRLVGSKTVRYFFVGEYGDRTFRPHYHAILFGYGPGFAETVEKAWSMNGTPLGYVQVGPADKGSHSYVAHYVTKKMTVASDERLEGRYPEFTRKSSYPPIGRAGLIGLARALNTEKGALVVATKGFPKSFRIQGAIYPFFRKDWDFMVSKAGYSPLDDEIQEQWRQEDRWSLDQKVASIWVDGENNGWSSARIEAAVRSAEREKAESDKAAASERAKRIAEKLWRRRQENQREL